MVKSITYTAVALALCIGLFIFTQWYLGNQFGEFSDALDALYVKVEDKSATAEDAYAVREIWKDKKSKLHIFIPHNDISYIDYWLSECLGLLHEGNHELALGKVEVLKEIAENLPDAYTVKLENIF
ncbi:MAG: DUF4363 family protein [Clostridia bacterium]|nr:DUF4363 family protein [Clostridia bacterium]